MPDTRQAALGDVDASLYPYSPEHPHDVASVTKSITSEFERGSPR